MTEADALQAIIASCPRIQKDLHQIRWGVSSVHRREADFSALRKHLSELTKAIEVLGDITGLADDIPWRELQRLGTLCSRADFRADLRTLEATLKDTLPELQSAARELADHLDEYPEL